MDGQIEGHNWSPMLIPQNVLIRKICCFATMLLPALAQVLATVRSFSAVSGRRPTLPEIAQHSGLSLGEVRFALLYARVLVR